MDVSSSVSTSSTKRQLPPSPPWSARSKLRRTLQVFIRIALVPCACDDQTEHRHEVVIEQHGERAALSLECDVVEGAAVEHENRRDLGGKALRDVVPALEDVKAGAARPHVEALNDPLEAQRFAASGKGVGAHGAAKGECALLKVIVRGEGVQNTRTEAVGQRMLEQLAGTGVRDLGPLVRMALGHRQRAGGGGCGSGNIRSRTWVPRAPRPARAMPRHAPRSNRRGYS